MQYPIKLFRQRGLEKHSFARGLPRDGAVLARSLNFYRNCLGYWVDLRWIHVDLGWWFARVPCLLVLAKDYR